MKTANITAIYPTINNNKVQIEFRDEFEKESTAETSANVAVDLLGILNRSDSRFKPRNQVVMWATTELIDAVDLFPQIATEIKTVANTGEPIKLDKPVEGTMRLDNQSIPTRIQVLEGHILKSNDLPYIETKAKKIPGKDGSADIYLTKDNMLIFRNTKLVRGDKPFTNEFVQYEERTTDISKTTFIMDGFICQGVTAEVLSTVDGEVVENPAIV